MEGATIETKSRECVALFEDIDKDIDHENLVDGSKFPVIRDQAARFKIWTAQLEAFTRTHGSIEERLRGDDNLRQAMLDQLLEYQESLERIIRYTKHVPESQSVGQPDLPNVFLGLEQSSETSSSISSVATSTTSSATYYSTVPVLVQELRAMEQIVDRLGRMSTIIQAPTFNDHQIKAAENFVLKDEGQHDIGQAFEEFAATTIRLRCPDISEVLLARLSHAVLLRRKRFESGKQNQSKHERALPVNQRYSEYHTAAPMAAFDLSTSNALQSSEEVLPQLPKRSEQRTSPSSKVLPQDASSTKWFNDSTRSLEEHDPLLWKGSLHIPPPPRISSIAKEFECPYCLTMLSLDKATSKGWIDHVLRDLEPFICVYDQCESEHVIFPDKQTWASHLEHHTISWKCNSPGHDPMRFSSGDAYEQHMEDAHMDESNNTLHKAQIPFLRLWAERKEDTPLHNCPFCPFEEYGAESGVQSGTLLDHIQYHLISIALISLPFRDDTGEKAKLASSKAASRKNSDIWDDLSSLASGFEDLGSNFRPGDDEDLILRSQATASEGASLEREWGPMSFSSPYIGPEFDPVLQRFLKEIYLGSAPAAGALGNVKLPCCLGPPPSDRGCLGRETVIKEMESVLCPTKNQDKPEACSDDKELKVFAICGPGGIGKTSVAREFVQRNYDRFDAVLWFRGDSRTKLLQDFRRAAQELQLVARGSVDFKDRMMTCDLVKKFLIDPKKPGTEESNFLDQVASWLVVFDGVDDHKILKDFLPYGGPGSILITGRDSLPYSRVHELGPLDTADSAQLLLHLTGRDETSEEVQLAAEVANKVEGFPLALTHLASMINKRQCSLSKFIDAYEKKEAEDITNPLDNISDVHYKYRLAWNWGLDSLKFGHVLLDILSMLDPDGIPESLLTTQHKRTLPDIYSNIANEYAKAKTELLQSSLMLENKSNNNISLHRLVTDVARSRMSSSRYCMAFLRGTRIVSDAWPYATFGWRHDVERWNECEKLFPHVLRLVELSKPVQILPGDRLDGHYEFARLLTDAAWYHHERGGSYESAELSRLAQAILETLLTKLTGSKSKFKSELNDKVLFTLAEIRHNRGCFATETNEPEEALLQFTMFNDLMTAQYSNGQLPSQDVRLAISWNELGISLMLNNRHVEAEPCFRKSLLAMKAQENFDPLQLSLPLVNLGLAYWLMNRSDEAASILLDGLAEREKALGKNDQDSFITGRFLHALGNVKATQGHLDESFTYHHRALVQYRSTLGKNHHRTADLCVIMALHHSRMKFYELSLALLNQALEAYAETDTFLREKLRARFNRAKIYRAQDRLVEAEAEAHWCLQKHREITGEEKEHLGENELNDLIAFWSR